MPDDVTSPATPSAEPQATPTAPPEGTPQTGTEPTPAIEPSVPIVPDANEYVRTKWNRDEEFAEETDEAEPEAADSPDSPADRSPAILDLNADIVFVRYGLHRQPCDAHHGAQGRDCFSGDSEGRHNRCGGHEAHARTSRPSSEDRFAFPTT